MASVDRFDEVSPDVGEIDESVVSEMVAEAPDDLLAALAEMSHATDERLRELAKALAAKLFLDLARTQRPDVAGIGRIATLPYRPDAGDLDVDRSLEGVVTATAERRLVHPDELAIRAWTQPSTAWCLVVDRSGSMRGRPLATAAMAAAAVAVRADGEYAVLSFSRDVVAPKAIWETRSDDEVIDRVLALRGHGTTDVAGALLAAAEQLRWATAARRVTMLLSDCRATEAGDVVGAAAALDELVILAPEGDHLEASELASEVGARLATVTGPASVAAAVSSVLDR